MGLGSADVEKEAISDNLSSLMGIVQVHTQMNSVHEELKDACTLELAHDVFTTDSQEAFNENEPGAGFEQTGSEPTSFSDDDDQGFNDSFTTTTAGSSVSGSSYSTEESVDYDPTQCYTCLYPGHDHSILGARQVDAEEEEM